MAILTVKSGKSYHERVAGESSLDDASPAP